MKINLRESLNKIDLATNNKYDLLNTFDSKKLSDNSKKKLAEAINNNSMASVNKILHESEEQLFKVVIQSGATKRNFESALYEDEAEEIVDYYGGRWIDENGFEWSMYVEEDDDSTEHAIVDNSYDTEDDDERAQREMDAYDQSDRDWEYVESLKDKNVLEYDDEISDEWIDMFDIASPQDVADSFKKDIKSKNKIYKPTNNESLKESYEDFFEIETNLRSNSEIKMSSGSWKVDTIYLMYDSAIDDAPHLIGYAHDDDGNYDRDALTADEIVNCDLSDYMDDIDIIDVERMIEDNPKYFYTKFNDGPIKFDESAKRSSKSLEEASYGGAYDIEDDMFFTKEEIVELADEVCSLLKEKFGYDYETVEVGMVSTTDLYLCIQDIHGVEEESTFRIDMRKIRKPSDLFKYAKPIAGRLAEKFEEEYQYYDFDESLNEAKIIEPKYKDGDIVFIGDADGYHGTFLIKGDFKNIPEELYHNIRRITKYGNLDKPYYKVEYKIDSNHLFEEDYRKFFEYITPILKDANISILRSEKDIDYNESLKEDTVKQNKRSEKKFNSREDAEEFMNKLPKEAEARMDYFDHENEDGSVSDWYEVYYWENPLIEDTVKTKSGKWVNKGDTGKTHGKFKTKKAADAQRKAMFANGYKAESLNEQKYSSGNYFLTVDKTGMGPHYSLYYQHPHSGYDGLMFIVDGYGYDNFKEKLSKFSTVYPNKDVQNLLKNINENKSVSINDKSLKEKLVPAPQEVVDELLSILEKYDFVLDDSLKHPIGKIWSGNTHIQVINKNSSIEETDDPDIYSEQLMSYIPDNMENEIDRLSDKSGCRITYSFGINRNWQVTGGLDVWEKYVPGLQDESLKEDYDKLSGYNMLSSTLKDGGDTYALLRKTEDGKTKWAAAKYVNGIPDEDNIFEITYEQARGFEPLTDTGKMSRKLGKALLPKKENLKEDLSDLDLILNTPVDTKQFNEETFKALKNLVSEYKKDLDSLDQWALESEKEPFVKKWYKLADKCKEIAKNGIKGITGYGRLNDFIKFKVVDLARSVDNTFPWYTRNNLAKFNKLESLNEDLSSIQEVKQLNFNNNRVNNLRGIFSIKNLVKALNDTGLDALKIRTSRLSNVSSGDLKDSWYDLRRNGWTVSIERDPSLSGFNEVYVFEKIKNESLKEALDDEIDIDYETDFDDDGVEEGNVFVEGGVEYAWIQREAGPLYLDFDKWAVWSAREYVDPREFMTIHDDGKGYDFDGDAFKEKAMAAPITYFVVDEDTGFIDWGPEDSEIAAKDFLNGKKEDWENDMDESLNEDKELKEYYSVNLHYEDIGDGREYDYEADYDDVLEYLMEYCVDDDNAPEDTQEYMEWVVDNFDYLFKKYEDALLKHFYEDASQEEYDERHSSYEQEYDPMD